MSRKSFAGAACSAVLAVCSTSSAADCGGIWSSSGKQPRVGDAYTADSIPSPDKKLSVSVSDESVEMLRQNGGAAGLNVPANTAFMEILWSPESTSFSINVSEGTQDGPWQTFAYVVKNETPSWLTLYDAKNAAGALPRCETKTAPNLATLAWLEGGKEILVVAEVPDLPSCKNKNEVAGYRVSAETGKVIENLDAATLQQKFGKELGCRLK
jgi:hypothetical protein